MADKAAVQMEKHELGQAAEVIKRSLVANDPQKRIGLEILQSKAILSHRTSSFKTAETNLLLHRNWGNTDECNAA